MGKIQANLWYRCECFSPSDNPNYVKAFILQRTLDADAAMLVSLTVESIISVNLLFVGGCEPQANEKREKQPFIYSIILMHHN